MSSTVYPKKRLPISVSLGITTQLSGSETFFDDRFASLSEEELKTILFNSGSLAFICKDQKRQKSKLSEFLIFLTIRRALALKSHTKKPVMVVVYSWQIGKQVATELARHTTDYKLYNMISKIKDKINKDLKVKLHTQADFILLTYHQLRDIVFDVKCPKVEQIIFVNPLTKYNSHREVIALDDITAVLHKHKRRKVQFTYVFDANYFPVMQKKDYQYLLDVDDCLFFGCNEKPVSLYNNILSSVLEYLADEHIQFFIWRELYRKRGLFSGLVQQFKKSLTYKLHVLSNGLYPKDLADQGETAFIKYGLREKADIDKEIKGKIGKTLQLFTKKTTKTIIGEKQVDFEHQKITYSWEEPIETPPFLPLVEKKRENHYYYLTELGETVFTSASHHAGAKIRFSTFLHETSNRLFRKKKSPAKFTLEEIINLYRVLIGIDPEELPDTIKDCIAVDADQTDQELAYTFDSFIEREFGFIIKDYSNHAAKTLLNSFEEFMDENALFFFNRLKNYKEKKKRARKEDLPEAILKTVKYKPLLIGKVSQKLNLDYNLISRELKKLETQELVVAIKTMINDGSTRLKYCQPEVLKQYPYLKKECGICTLYKKRFNSCPFLKLIDIYNPTQFPTGFREYVCNAVRETATPCKYLDEHLDLEIEGEQVRYTITIEALAQKMRIVEGSFLLGQEGVKYSCVNCQTVIEEFGTGEELFFPRRRILCPNCATGYYRKDEQTVLIQTEHRDVLRGKYFELTGSIPKILKEGEPSYAYVIYDNEEADLLMNKENSMVLEICKHKVPLKKVQYIYFAGKEHQRLERFLTHLSNIRPERFNYSINRSPQKEEEELALREGCEPFTSEQYHKVHELIAFISEEELLNNPFLRGRHLSNIGALLKYRREASEKNEYLTSINRQLYEMVDLLLIVQAGVKSSYYGRQLEGQSQNCLYDLLKEEGEKMGLWTHGRVISRLVKDLFLSSTVKVSNARAPLDALLNQVLRQFRSIINKVFRKIGLNPYSLGAGLIHKRKTKSDIDQKGLYFDFIEPVGSLALITLLRAITEGLFSDDDCSLELAGSGQLIYRVKQSSLEKIEEMVEKALAELVYYRGEKITFLAAFEENLLSFKQAMQLCFDKCADGKELSSKIISQSLKIVGFIPFVYCPVGCEEELDIINKFAVKYSSFFEEREEQVLEAREKRTVFRIVAKKKWWQSNGERGKKKLQLTKYQAREQERSLLVALVLLYLDFQMHGLDNYYSTRELRGMLHLTQNQAQRILTKMVAQGLLQKMRYKKQSFYQFNFDNRTVQELLFTLEQIPCEDKKMRLKFLRNSGNVIERMNSLLLKVQQIKEGLSVNVGWKSWKLPQGIEQIIELYGEKTGLCLKAEG